MSPGLTQFKSPPLEAVLSSEYCLAKASNFSPLSKRSLMPSILSLPSFSDMISDSLIKICLAWVCCMTKGELPPRLLFNFNTWKPLGLRSGADTSPTCMAFKASRNKAGICEAFFQPRLPPSKALGASEKLAETLAKLTPAFSSVSALSTLLLAFCMSSVAPSSGVRMSKWAISYSS